MPMNQDKQPTTKSSSAARTAGVGTATGDYELAKPFDSSTDEPGDGTRYTDRVQTSKDGVSRAVTVRQEPHYDSPRTQRSKADASCGPYNTYDDIVADEQDEELNHVLHDLCHEIGLQSMLEVQEIQLT